MGGVQGMQPNWPRFDVTVANEGEPWKVLRSLTRNQARKAVKKYDIAEVHLATESRCRNLIEQMRNALLGQVRNSIAGMIGK